MNISEVILVSLILPVYDLLTDSPPSTITLYLNKTLITVKISIFLQLLLFGLFSFITFFKILTSIFKNSILEKKTIICYPKILLKP